MKFDEAHLVEWVQITNRSPGLCLSDIITIFFVPSLPTRGIDLPSDRVGVTTFYPAIIPWEFRGRRKQQ